MSRMPDLKWLINSRQARRANELRSRKELLHKVAARLTLMDSAAKSIDGIEDMPRHLLRDAPTTGTILSEVINALDHEGIFLHQNVAAIMETLKLDKAQMDELAGGTYGRKVVTTREAAERLLKFAEQEPTREVHPIVILTSCAAVAIAFALYAAL